MIFESLEIFQALQLQRLCNSVARRRRGTDGQLWIDKIIWYGLLLHLASTE
jgi:hypothetical protein